MSKFALPACFGAAICLGVIFGAQTEDWSWGPSLLALSLFLFVGSVTQVRPVQWTALKVLLLVTVSYVFLRAFQSPVLDAARADALLAGALLGSALGVSRMSFATGQIRGLFIVLSFAAIGNLVVAGIQGWRPEFLWPYQSKPSESPTGFFGHYNYFANFVGGAGLLCLARAVLVRDPIPIRLQFVGTFLGALVMIPLSGSRGGSLAFGLGMFVFMACLGILAWRNRSKAATAFLAILPIGLIVIGLGGVWLLKKTQDIRSDGSSAQSVAALADNGRLEWIKLATEVARTDTMFGGGSRAFSWKRNHAWALEELGRGIENERFVHNELVQTITDYGLVGAFFVILAVGALFWRAVVQLFLGPEDEAPLSERDAIAIGILAAGSFMLLQSNVSFVFHLLPSTMLLGVIFGLGMLLPVKSVRAHTKTTTINRAGGVFIAGVIGWYGILATLAFVSLWPVVYRSDLDLRRGSSEALRRLETSAKWWPGYRIQEEIGRLCRLTATSVQGSEADARWWNERAVEAYAQASRIHPFHPGFQVNSGNILSDLGRAEKAEAALERAIVLQGGLEGGFRARLCLAQHLYRTWYQRWQNDRRAGEALHEFLRARDLLDESDVHSQWAYKDSKALRKSLDQVIQFLEGAQVVAVPPSGSD